MLIKLCDRQIYELAPGVWRGVARLSRGTPEIARVLYEGPATITIQYAIVGRAPTVRPRLGDPISIADISVRDHNWPSYDPRRHLRSDGLLVINNFILELFHQEADDHASVQ